MGRLCLSPLGLLSQLHRRGGLSTNRHFSKFCALGSPRSRRWQILFLVHRQLTLLIVLDGQEGWGALWGLFYKGVHGSYS